MNKQAGIGTVFKTAIKPKYWLGVPATAAGTLAAGYYGPKIYRRFHPSWQQKAQGMDQAIANFLHVKNRPYLAPTVFAGGLGALSLFLLLMNRRRAAQSASMRRMMPMGPFSV